MTRYLSDFSTLPGCNIDCVTPDKDVDKVHKTTKQLQKIKYATIHVPHVKQEPLYSNYACYYRSCSDSHTKVNRIMLTGAIKLSDSPEQIQNKPTYSRTPIF
jgi:hypothetical protein